MTETQQSRLRIWTASTRLFAFLTACLCVSAGMAAESDVYFVKTLWTGQGQPLVDAAMVIQDGKITAVGRRAEVKIPKDAKQHELDQAVVIPGLVVAETQLASDSRNGAESLAAQLRAIDGFDFFGDYAGPLSGGVTTVQVSPGGARLVPGQGAVVKLAGKKIDERILSERESLRLVLSQASRNPPKIYKPPVGAVSVDNPLKPTSPQIGRSLASAVSGLRAMLRVAQREAARDDVDLDPDPLLQTITEYQSGKRTFRITASTSTEIRAAIRMAIEFNLQFLLVDISTTKPLERQLDGVGKQLRGVVLNAGVRPGSVTNLPVPAPDQPAKKMAWDHARWLVDRGVKVAIRPAADSDLSELLFIAGLFQQGGLGPEEILRSLTLTPAELLGVSNRVGSLAKGKDADFVVLSGRPFATRTRVLATYIGGKRVFDSAKKKKTTVIQVAEIHDGLGGVISSGTIVVEGGKIRGLGDGVSAPLDAQIRRFPGAVIVPGFIDLATGLGVGGSIGSVSVRTKLGAQLDPTDPTIAIARQGGVTTVLLGSTGSSPSAMVAFKLGSKLRVLKDPVALRFSIKGNLSSTVPSLKRTLTSARAYSAIWAKYESNLAQYKLKLKPYLIEKAKYDAAVKAAEAKKKADAAKKAAEAKKAEEEKKKAEAAKPGTTKPAAAKPATTKPATTKPAAAKPATAKPATATLKAPVKPTEPKKPATSSSLEPYRGLFAKKIPAFVEARNINELRAALKLFRDEFQLKTIIIGADDAMRIPDLLSEKKVGVSIGPTLVRTVDRQVVNTAQILANRQIPFGFQSQATTGVKTLPLAVQFAVRKGLGEGDALRGLTSSPAKLLSLDSQVGTLSVGKDADLVVLSGPPFELSTRVIAVMIDGEWVYEGESKP